MLHRLSLTSTLREEIERLCKKFHDYRREKPPTIEYAARGAPETVALDIPARRKPKLVDNMNGVSAVPHTTRAERPSADRTLTRDKKKIERQTAVAVVIENTRTTRSRNKQASDAMDIDLDPPEYVLMWTRWFSKLTLKLGGQLPDQLRSCVCRHDGLDR